MIGGVAELPHSPISVVCGLGVHVYLQAYETPGIPLLPAGPTDLRALMDLFVLQMRNFLWVRTAKWGIRRKLKRTKQPVALGSP